MRQGMSKETGLIGFGTPALLALTSERERQALLGAALDSGITHFDTAPYYGYGEAEKILGRFIKDRRDEVTITTKFGIQPPRLAGGGSVAGAVKRLVKNLGPVRKLLARQAGKMVQRAAFGADDAAKSLEASLRALQTEHIDIYLLHEAGPSDTSDELLAFLEEKKKQGIIGRFGTGSDFRKVLAMATARKTFADVLQFENSVVRPNLRSLAGVKGGVLTITHGALSGSFRELNDALQTDVALRRSCSEVLAVDAGDSRHLAAAMLLWAAHDNPQGMVLFSSSRMANLRANMEVWGESRFTSEQLEQFARLVAAGLPLNEGIHP